MHLPLHIARRYLFGKKSHNIINIISGISTLGVAIGTMAMIIVLSVFNGFHDLVSSMFSSFNPSIQITAASGKFFDPTELSTKIKQVKGVANYVEVLEENALIKFKEKQCIATLKGVSPNYTEMLRMDTMLVTGGFILNYNNRNYTVIGAGIAYQLSIYDTDMLKTLQMYVARNNGAGISDPLNAFNADSVGISGIFSVQQEIDSKYMIVPIALIRQLLDQPVKVSAIEIGVDPTLSVNTIKKQIASIAGKDFIVKDRYEQQEMLYRIMQSEKLIILIILTFILFIAIVNTIGSLTLLILDKKKDIAILTSMGATNALIKRIFFTEGMMISVAGGLIGLLLGWLVCLLQQQFGLVKFPAGTFVIDTYPVVMKPLDFLITLGIVLSIGTTSIWFLIHRISSRFLNDKLS